MDTDMFDIQKLVTESGVPRRTIYFYVQQGLLPPPQGAGLAAYYTAEHLIRLQLIPVLRSQGLRLDGIRERFAMMPVEEMRRVVQAHREREAKERSALEETFAQRSMREPGPGVFPRAGIAKFEAGLNNEAGLSASAPGWVEQRLIQYTFPGGITLMVPENLEEMDRQRFEQLLLAARRIFGAAQLENRDQSFTGGKTHA